MRAQAIIQKLAAYKTRDYKMNHEKEVLIDFQDGIAVITLNRPKALNAINMPMRKMLEEAIEELDEDEKIRVILLTGAGEKAFCVGGDIKERREMSLSDIRRVRHSPKNIYTLIENLNKPTIAVLHGYVLGGGLELALACDIRLASEGTIFGFPEVTIGVIPAGGGTQRLPRLIGLAKTKELIFTGMRIDAKEALEIGLVNRLFSQEGLWEKSLEMARVIAKNPPLSVRGAKKAINMAAHDINPGLAFEVETYLNCFGTKDRQEALAALREKRQPSFMGE